MNDRLAPSVVITPYRGLDFFREEHEFLFTEREKEIRECASMLLQLDVKIFVLQGSTGAGKSSFLRAGLIPRLRRWQEDNIHFLADGDCVIRCTSDPLRWIAAALSTALASQRFAVRDAADYIRQLAYAPARSSKELADIILSTLHGLCRELAGHLVLVLDQAEELLTRTNDECELARTAKEFFYFLEEIYLRNIDVRIVVALRTEYYGRFRDELRIDDDRIAERPCSGGVQPYLLRPLRDPAALARIILAPTLLEGERAFRFSIEPAAVQRIVDDLLAYFTHGSVTPFLQVICAILHKQLARRDQVITLRDYKRLGELGGIAVSYLYRGVSQALPPLASKEEKEKWLLLLHKLISRQGGGTVVSEIESLAALQEKARSEKIAGDIDKVLLRLCTGTTPLLRGLPDDRHPTQFSLKHDVLAVVLVRWHVSYVTARKTQAERRKKTNRVMWATGTAALLTVVMGGVLFFALGRQRAREDAIEKRLDYALKSPRSDFAQSLVLIVDSLGALHNPPNILSRLFIWPDRALSARAEEQLRATILRSPLYSGEYLAAGFDTTQRALLLMKADSSAVMELHIPSQSSGGSLPAVRELKLPDNAASNMRSGNTAVGFMPGLGPVTVIAEKLYYWEGQDTDAVTVDLVKDLAVTLLETPIPARPEIVGGALQITQRTPTAEGFQIRGMRITGADIKARIVAAEPIILEQTKGLPQALLFSESPARPAAYAYLAQENDQEKKASRLNWQVERDFSGQAPQTIAGVWSQRAGAPTSTRFSFVLGADAALVHRDGVGFTYHDFSGAAARAVDIHFDHAGKTSRMASLPMRSYSRWAYSPLASHYRDGTLSIAMVAKGGVVTARGKLGQPFTFSPNNDPDHPLLAGEPNGSRLQYSDDATLLVLQQQPFAGNPMRVRVWDLSDTRAQHIRTLNSHGLVALACGIVHDALRNLPDPDQSTVELMRISGAEGNACMQPKEQSHE